MRFSRIVKYTRYALAWEEGREQGFKRPVVCEQLGIRGRTLDSAIAWRHKQVYELSDKSVLDSHIAALKAHVEKYEQIQDNLLKPYNKVAVPTGAANSIVGVGRLILQYRTRLMELEGIYKQVVNPQLHGANGNKVQEIRYVAVPPDESEIQATIGGTT